MWTIWNACTFWDGKLGPSTTSSSQNQPILVAILNGTYGGIIGQRK
jgi:hypothetical protein